MVHIVAETFRRNLEDTAVTLAELLGEPRVITDRKEAAAFLWKFAKATGQDVSREIKWLAQLPACRLEVHQDGVRVASAESLETLEFELTETGSFDRIRKPFVYKLAELMGAVAADCLALSVGDEKKTPKSLLTLLDLIQDTITTDKERFENVMAKLAAYDYKLGELHVLLIDAGHTGISGASARRLSEEIGRFFPALVRVYLDFKDEKRALRREQSEKLDALYKI